MRPDQTVIFAAKPFRMIRSVFFLLVLVATAPLWGQSENTLHFQRHLFQSSHTNPAFRPAERLVVGLGGIAGGLHFRGPSFADIIQEEDDRKILDVDFVISQMERRNLLREDLSVETIGAALRTDDWTFSLGHRIRSEGFFEYPKTLAQVVFRGNAQFIGETVDLSTNFQISSYHEFYVGAAYEFGGLTIGARAKYLNGIAYLKTVRNDLLLTTSDDAYQLTLDTDYLIQSAGLLDYRSIDDFDFNFGFQLDDFSTFFSNNGGYAFDLGAQYELNNLTLALSVTDLGGRIEWSEQVENLISRRRIQYDGLDISEALTGGEADFAGALDTLETLLDFEVDEEIFSSRLNSRSYFSILHEISEAWSVGGLLSLQERQLTDNEFGFTLAARYRPLEQLHLGLTYASRRNDFDNLGLQTTLTLGPAQLYAMTDDLLGIVDYRNRKGANFRVGLNLVFGKPEL